MSSLIDEWLARFGLYIACMQTSMRVSPANRDALAKIAATELGGASLDEALRVLVFEHQSRVGLTRLAADPDAWRQYQAESATLAEVDADVRE